MCNGEKTKRMRKNVQDVGRKVGNGKKKEEGAWRILTAKTMMSLE